MPTAHNIYILTCVEGDGFQAERNHLVKSRVDHVRYALSKMAAKLLQRGWAGPTAALLPRSFTTVRGVSRVLPTACSQWCTAIQWTSTRR